MTRAFKAARISSGGYYPPRGLNDPRGPDEDGHVEDWYDSDDEEDLVPVPPSPGGPPSPEPDVPQVEEDPEEVEVVDVQPLEVILPEPINIPSDDEEDVVVDDADDYDQPLPPGGGAIGGGEQPPELGWTKEVFHPEDVDTEWHLKLMHLLNHYFFDWHPAVACVCTRYTHPMEKTYWKTEVQIFSREFGYVERKLERSFYHIGHRETQEDSMESAAYEAWLRLHGHRRELVEGGNLRLLPYTDVAYEAGGIMMDPNAYGPEVRALGRFCEDLLAKNKRLESMVLSLGKSFRRLQLGYDELKETMGEPRVYRKWDHVWRP
jgi:hypothetical protein